MISIYLRGKVWWARDSRRDKRFSLKTRHKDVAGQRAAHLELEQDRHVQMIAWEAFENEFLARCQTEGLKLRTLAKYRFVCNRFGKFLGDIPTPYVTPATIAAYVREREKDKHPTRGTLVGPAGIRADLRVLKRAFTIARECGYIEANPVKVARLNAQGRETLPFTQEQVDAMLADTARRSALRAIVLFMLHTGLRIGDVEAFPREAVDFSSGLTRLRTEKRGKTVTLGLHDSVVSALRPFVASFNDAQKASGLLFPTKEGKPMTSLDAYLRRMFERCGIQRGHAHRFRDTFAVRLLARGASIYDVAKMLGNTVAVAERHYAPFVKELQDRATQLARTLDFVACTRRRRESPTRS